MSSHNICFYGEIAIIIPELSLNTLLICSTVLYLRNYYVLSMLLGNQMYCLLASALNVLQGLFFSKCQILHSKSFFYLKGGISLCKSRTSVIRYVLILIIWIVYNYIVKPKYIKFNTFFA